MFSAVATKEMLICTNKNLHAELFQKTRESIIREVYCFVVKSYHEIL